MMRIRSNYNIDINIMTKEMLYNHTGIGITPSVLNIGEEDSLLLNDRYSFKFNVPRDLKIREFIKFLEVKTGINYYKFKLFIYFSNDQYKVLNRFQSWLAYINPTLHENTFANYFKITNIKQNGVLYFYINLSEYELFTINDYIEDREEVVNIEDNTYLYYSLKQYYKMSKYDNSPDINEIIPANQYTVLIFKSINENKLKITNIECLDKQYILNDEIDIETLIFQSKTTDIKYYIELSSFKFDEFCIKKKAEIDIKDYLSQFEISDNLIKIKDLNTIREFIGSNINTLCILRTGESNPETIYDKLYTQVFLRLHYEDELVGNHISILLNESKKFEFNLKDDYIITKKKILKYTKENIDLAFLFQDIYKLYFMDSESNLMTCENFISRINEDNIFFIQGPYHSIYELENFPLLKYISVENKFYPRIQYHFDLNIPKDNIDERMEDDIQINNIKLNLLLFDRYNNPLAKLIFVYSETDTKCKTIIDYLYESVITKLYNPIPDINSFYFILQNENSFFAYDILINSQNNLFKYSKHNLNIIYRLQPLEEIDINKKKLFIAFSTKDFKSACDPIILFVDDEVTVLEMKNIIYEKIKNIDKLEHYDIESEKIKFYTYSLIEYKPHKGVLLLKSKDDDMLFKYCKHNILVEIPSDSIDSINLHMT